MLFNSNAFLAFFAAFLLLYYLVRRSLFARNVLIVASSYFFYGWWDYRFLGLLAFSSGLDFFVGLRLDATTDPSRRRRWLILSLTGNLGVLAGFKYFDFFTGSIATGLEALGFSVWMPMLHLVLPVGISFYTFQSLSYTMDVYRREIQATRDWVSFLAYVSFFPQLVAGPIERARRLLPQFEQTRRISAWAVEEGIWLCLWGMFKKVVLADNLAPLVEMVFDQPGVAGPVILLGTLAFGMQIYCDFSGYSDIARGLARLMGFDLMVNFDLPYVAQSLREFWQRWHISLSTWLRDYLYISLGGNRRGRPREYFNLLITLVLGGLWHGAAWNFVLWGVWHGVALAAERRFRGRISSRWIPGGRGVMAWIVTMTVVFYGWLLFRAHSLEQIVRLTRDAAGWTVPDWIGGYTVNLVVFTAPVVLMQVWQKRSGDLQAPLRVGRLPKALLQGILFMSIVSYWQRDASPFIYFQF